MSVYGVATIGGLTTTITAEVSLHTTTSVATGLLQEFTSQMLKCLNLYFYFWHNFAICWGICTIFEASSSGLIAGWCNLWTSPFTITHHAWRHSSCCAQCALTPDFIPPDLWPLNSPDLNPADYSFWSIMQEKVYQTHLANIDELKRRLVQVWAELDHRHRCRTAATPSQCVWLMCESSGGYFDQHLRWIYM